MAPGDRHELSSSLTYPASFKMATLIPDMVKCAMFSQARVLEHMAVVFGEAAEISGGKV